MIVAWWLAHLNVALFAFLLLARRGHSLRSKALLGLGCLALPWLPLDGLSLGEYVRSFTDDLAFSSLLLLAWLVAQRCGYPQAGNARLPVLALFAVLALLLYPATLGLSYFDPYRHGYDPQLMLLPVALCALACLAWRNYLGLAMLLVPTLAFALALKPSSNYWDYLLDPLLALYCWGWLASWAVAHGLRRKAVAA